MQKQSGNALILILIAIALLGGLTVLMSRTSSQTEETGDLERLSIHISTMLNYTASVKATVDRMLANGISETDISFANNASKTCDDDDIMWSGHNPNCLSQECEVFGTGGGLRAKKMPPELGVEDCFPGAWTPGATAVLPKVVVGVGTSLPDLTMTVARLSRSACLAINNRLGIDNPGGNPPQDNGTGGGTFDGEYPAGSVIIGDQVPALEGKKTFCIQNSAGGDYEFIQVLIAR